MEYVSLTSVVSYVTPAPVQYVTLVPNVDFLIMGCSVRVLRKVRQFGGGMALVAWAAAACVLTLALKGQCLKMFVQEHAGASAWRLIRTRDGGHVDSGENCDRSEGSQPVASLCPKV